MSGSMSGSDRLDIVTNIFTFVVVFISLLKQSLPRIRLTSLEAGLDKLESSLHEASEEGLLGNDSQNFTRRLKHLRVCANDLALRVHTAQSLPLQCVELLRGLTCKLCKLHNNINTLSTDIRLKKAQERSKETCDKAAPPSPPTTELDIASQTQTRVPSANSSGIALSSANIASRIAFTAIPESESPERSDSPPKKHYCPQASKIPTRIHSGKFAYPIIQPHQSANGN